MDESSKKVQRCLHKAVILFESKEQELGRLDAAAGDGDHGATMVRGLKAASVAVDSTLNGGQPSEVGDLLVCAGDAFADAAGGASGALFGILVCTIGRRLAQDGESPAAVQGALAAGLGTVAKMGKVVLGDKTLLDALEPFVQSFGVAVEQGQSITTAWEMALPAAVHGAAATAGMTAKRGRAAVLGERSRGHIDPGAQSIVYLLECVKDVLCG